MIRKSTVALLAVAASSLAQPAWSQCWIEELSEDLDEGQERLGGEVSLFEGSALVSTEESGLATESVAFAYERDDNGTPTPDDDRWLAIGTLGRGEAVALGSNVAVQGHNQDPQFGFNAGSAAVYVRDDRGTPADKLDDAWVFRGTLVSSETQTFDFFGRSVAVSEDSILIGATGEDDDTGAAYVFERDDNGTPEDPLDDAWVEVFELTAAAAVVDDIVGWCVALDGDLAVLGAPQISSDGKGTAFVFQRDDQGTPTDRFDDTWIELDQLLASDGAPNDFFGASVSVSNDTILVGARLDDLGPGSIAEGSAYVFERDDNGTPDDPFDDSWIETCKLFAADASNADFFGVSVSISGDLAAIGAQSADVDNISGGGATYLFARDDMGTPDDRMDDVWTQTDKLATGDLDRPLLEGESVWLDGTTLIVGAQGVSGAAGVAYLYAVDVDCPFWAYGDGLAGAGALAPAIDGTGSLLPGTTVTIEVLDGLGGAFGCLVGGPSPSAAAFAGGTLLVSPTTLVFPHTLSGSPGAPGEGSFSMDLPVPNDSALVGLTCFFQAGYLDSAAPAGIALSAGLRATIQSDEAQ